jgi:hypothetical protein
MMMMMMMMMMMIKGGMGARVRTGLSLLCLTQRAEAKVCVRCLAASERVVLWWECFFCCL